MRTHSGHMSTSGFSMDSMAPSEQSFHENGFGGGMHDMLSLDMSSRATPDSESTAASSSRLAFMPHSVGTQNTHNPVNKLDALMFPSDDPFAYPNQPMMELGFQPAKDGTVTMAQDPNFFFPGTLEEMGNSFVNQPPPYITPQNGRQSINMGNLYDSNGMMTMQHPGAAQALAQAQARQAQARAQAQAQAQAQARQQQAAQRAQQQQQQSQQQQGQQQQQTPQQQQRSRGFGFFHRRTRQPQEQQQAQQIDQMFTEHGMQPDFGSFFGSGRGGFQGM